MPLKNKLSERPRRPFDPKKRRKKGAEKIIVAAQKYAKVVRTHFVACKELGYATNNTRWKADTQNPHMYCDKIAPKLTTIRFYV